MKNKKGDSIAQIPMPQKINPNKSKMSVEVGEELKALLIAACESRMPPISPSAGVREAVVKWLAAADRKGRRRKAPKKAG